MDTLEVYPALRQRRTSNGPDAVTVHIQPALWMGVNGNKRIQRRFEKKIFDLNYSAL